MGGIGYFEDFFLYSERVINSYFEYLTSFAELITVELEFGEFQLKTLKFFCLVLLVNLILILILWRIYGSRISERFFRPASAKFLEELHDRAMELKLPKIHSPRL